MKYRPLQISDLFVGNVIFFFDDGQMNIREIGIIVEIYKRAIRFKTSSRGSLLLLFRYLVNNNEFYRVLI